MWMLNGPFLPMKVRIFTGNMGEIVESFAMKLEAATIGISPNWELWWRLVDDKKKGTRWENKNSPGIPRSSIEAPKSIQVDDGRCEYEYDMELATL